MTHSTQQPPTYEITEKIGYYMYTDTEDGSYRKAEPPIFRPPRSGVDLNPQGQDLEAIRAHIKEENNSFRNRKKFNAFVSHARKFLQESEDNWKPDVVTYRTNLRELSKPKGKVLCQKLNGVLFLHFVTQRISIDGAFVNSGRGYMFEKECVENSDKMRAGSVGCSMMHRSKLLRNDDSLHLFILSEIDCKGENEEDIELKLREEGAAIRYKKSLWLQTQLAGVNRIVIGRHDKGKLKSLDEGNINFDNVKTDEILSTIHKRLQSMRSDARITEGIAYYVKWDGSDMMVDRKKGYLLSRDNVQSFSKFFGNQNRRT